MKKFGLFFYLFIVSILLTGCGEEEETIKTADIHFDDSYYSVALPYLNGVGNHYVVDGSQNISIEDVDISLMGLSTTYYRTNNSLYQEGQYLTEEELEELLSSERLNYTDTIEVDGSSFQPTFITHIHEQNYLSTNHTLKGISLGIVLNPYQKISDYQYHGVDYDQVIQFGKEKALELISYLRQKEELKDVRIFVGLYVCGDPDEINSGSYQYAGITRNDQIHFEPIHYQYQYLTDSYVMEHDFNSYQSFLNFDNQLKLVNDELFSSAKGLYVDGRLASLEITIHGSYMGRSEILMIGQVISDQLVQLFDSSVYIHVQILINDEVKAFITKQRNSSITNFYVL